MNKNKFIKNLKINKFILILGLLIIFIQAQCYAKTPKGLDSLSFLYVDMPMSTYIYYDYQTCDIGNYGSFMARSNYNTIAYKAYSSYYIYGTKEKINAVSLIFHFFDMNNFQYSINGRFGILEYTNKLMLNTLKVNLPDDVKLALTNPTDDKQNLFFVNGHKVYVIKDYFEKMDVNKQEFVITFLIEL